MKKMDLTGQKFGRLTVLYELPERKNKKIYYHCKCICGNETDVCGAHLKKGTIKSCGCIKKEMLSKRQFIDITNQRFGNLVAIKTVGKDSAGQYLWLCQCDCGNQRVYSGCTLRAGGAISCGCQKSKGELKISQLLQSYNILFEQEKTFNNFIYADTNRKAQFDFYIVNKNYLIEFDGKQHFKIGGWNNNKSLNKCLEHDKIKNEWCLNNNIPLIRIPYTYLDKLTINDLLLETSPFIIKREVN